MKHARLSLGLVNPRSMRRSRLVKKPSRARKQVASEVFKAVSSMSQNTVVNTAFAKRLVVLITDSSGKPVTGVTVDFEAFDVSANAASGAFCARQHHDRPSTSLANPAPARQTILTPPAISRPPAAPPQAAVFPSMEPAR